MNDTILPAGIKSHLSQTINSFLVSFLPSIDFIVLIQAHVDSFSHDGVAGGVVDGVDGVEGLR